MCDGLHWWVSVPKNIFILQVYLVMCEHTFQAGYFVNVIILLFTT